MENKKLRKVRREGGTRVVSAPEIPNDWQYVYSTIVKKTQTSVVMRYEKVL